MINYGNERIEGRIGRDVRTTLEQVMTKMSERKQWVTMQLAHFVEIGRDAAFVTGRRSRGWFGNERGRTHSRRAAERLPPRPAKDGGSPATESPGRSKNSQRIM